MQLCSEPARPGSRLEVAGSALPAGPASDPPFWGRAGSPLRNPGGRGGRAPPPGTLRGAGAGPGRARGGADRGVRGSLLLRVPGPRGRGRLTAAGAGQRGSRGSPGRGRWSRPWSAGRCHLSPAFSLTQQGSRIQGTTSSDPRPCMHALGVRGGGDRRVGTGCGKGAGSGRPGGRVLVKSGCVFMCVPDQAE